MTPTEQLRQAIIESGISQAELCRQSGVPQPRLSVFLSGGGLKSDTFDALCATMGLELRKIKKLRKK